ncbi:hypothetical protein PanWU01x14_036050 [Parasponia andersonii]|uniref:Uncharacterized protein n=1 Tax=Parasponia andersonii TaxID=3476 RepID=A0A2P5DSB8_PARAD|nr:hypothetical protein PanWU01x14_036050 [Parasponia andersonii]
MYESYKYCNRRRKHYLNLNLLVVAVKRGEDSRRSKSFNGSCSLISFYMLISLFDHKIRR